jgi:MFS family permease
VQEGLALRPLGVGDIVDRVFGLYRTRPLMFLTIAAIPYLLLVLIVGALTVAFAGPALLTLIPLFTGAVTPNEAEIERLLPVLGTLAVYLLAVVIVALAVSLVQSASLIDAAAARYMGKETTVGAALSRGMRAALRLLLMGLAAFLAFCALWIAIVVLLAVVPQWWSFLIGIVGGAVASVFLAASWMVAPAVLILEGTGPIEALRRSWALSTGNRWRILGLILLLFVIQIVLSSLLSTILLASVATDQVVQLVIQQGINVLASIAWAPVYWGTFAVLYYDLRVRREGFDLQLAAEALPRAT